MIRRAGVHRHPGFQETFIVFHLPSAPRICAELATICASRALVATGHEPLHGAREVGTAMARELGVAFWE